MLAYLPIGSPAYEAAVTAVCIVPLAAERGLGLSATGFWSVALIAVFLALLSISCLLLWLIRLLDPHAMTMKSLLWTLRTAPCAIAWLAALAACAATALLVEGWLQSVAWFLFAIVFLLMPFLCLRSDIVASDHPPWIWKPHWPGLPAAALLLASVMALVGHGTLGRGVVVARAGNTVGMVQPCMVGAYRAFRCSGAQPRPCFHRSRSQACS